MTIKDDTEQLSLISTAIKLAADNIHSTDTAADFTKLIRVYCDKIDHLIKHSLNSHESGS